jgi:hypothetical protein
MKSRDREKLKKKRVVEKKRPSIFMFPLYVLTIFAGITFGIIELNIYQPMCNFFESSYVFLCQPKRSTIIIDTTTVLVYSGNREKGRIIVSPSRRYIMREQQDYRRYKKLNGYDVWIKNGVAGF